MANSNKYYANARWGAGTGAYTGGTGYSFSGSYGTQLYIYDYSSSSYNKYYTLFWQCLPNTTYKLTVTGDYHSNSTWLIKTTTSVQTSATLYDVSGLTKTYDSNTGLTTYQFTTGANANYVGLGNKTSVSNASTVYPASPRLLYQYLPSDWYSFNLCQYQTEEYVDFPFDDIYQGWAVGGTSTSGSLTIYSSTDYNYSRTAALVYSVPQGLSSKVLKNVKVTLRGDLSNDFNSTSTTTWIIKYAKVATLTNGSSLTRVNPSSISYDSLTRRTTFNISLPTNATYVLIANRVGSTSATSDLYTMKDNMQFYYDEGWKRKTNLVHKCTSGAWS